MDFQQDLQQSLDDERNQELKNNMQIIDEFIKYVNTLQLSLKFEDFDYRRTIGIVATHPGILKALLADISPDKEGLYSWTALRSKLSMDALPGFLAHEKCLIMAHPYFRRNFNSNTTFAPMFIHEFWRYQNEHADIFIALDENRIRVNVDSVEYCEFDTWYGPRFNRDVKSIKDGAVRIVPPQDIPPDICSRLFDMNHALDIVWHTNDQNIKTFQLEAIKHESVKVKIDGVPFHPVRYIHAEFDISQNCFRHFDGAIHFYTEPEYKMRRDSDLNFNRKIEKMIKSKSHKLFKFNGKIPVEDWQNFCVQFLPQNFLIFEYFEEPYPAVIQERLNHIRKNLPLS